MSGIDMHYVVNPILQKPNKKTVKEKLKIKLRLWKDRFKQIDYLTENYVPILYLPPQQFDYIFLKICSFRGGKFPDKFYINGKKAVVTDCFSNQKNVFFLLNSSQFIHWENIVSFKFPFNAADILLFPCSKKNPDEIFENYTLNYGVWEVYEVQAKSLCPRPVYNYKNNNLLSIKNKDIDENNLTIAAQYLMNCFNDDPNSDFRGTFYTAFDLDSQGFRAVSWTWTSAIVVSALLGEFKLNPKISKKIEPIVEKAADFFINHQIKDGPNKGGFMVRWDIWKTAKNGIVPWIAPNDAAFIGTNALLPLFEHYGDPKHLDAAQNLAEWIMKEGTRKDGLVYVGYSQDRDSWEQDWLYVDAAFTISFFEKLNQVRPDVKYKEWVSKFIDQFQTKFQLHDGLFIDILRKGYKSKNHIFTRGQGWALDGLISAYKLLGDITCLDSSIRIAEILKKHQCRDGSWYYSLYKKPSGQDAKAIPVIAFQLIRLYEITENQWVLEMSIRALKWCNRNQITVNESIAHGGLGSYSIEGAIAGKRNAYIIFSYSVAYYILAVRKLEAMGYNIYEK